MRRWGFVVTAAASLSVSVAAAQARPFTVDDGIEMVRINTGFESTDRPSAPRAFYRSAVARATLVVTRKGNLATGKTEYQLLKFDDDGVHHFISSGSAHDEARPQPSVLARFSTPSWTYGIGNVTWSPDGRRVFFVGRADDGIGRIYSVEVDGTGLRQVTHHEQDIEGFSLSENSEVLAFSAVSAPPDWTARNERGYALSAKQSLESLYLIDPQEFWNCCQQMSVHLRSGRVIRIETPPGWTPATMWISPGGRWAVTTGLLEDRYPAHWRHYAFIREERARQGAADRPDDAHVSEDGRDEAPLYILQFFLIDLSTGSSRALLDAPVGHLQPATHASWLDDERVIVGPTYLPLTEGDGASGDAESAKPAVVEINVRSGDVLPILEVPDGQTVGTPSAIVSLKSDRNGRLVIERRAGWPGAPLPPEVFLRKGDMWVKSGKAEIGSAKDADGIDYFIAEDLNTPPEIAARARSTGREKVLTDLNPQLRKVTLGRAEVFSWRDRLGRRHTGGVLKPPNLRKAERYPLVVQTYGFKADQFLLEGPPLPGKAVFAAQALANRGFVVLQLPREEVGAQTQQVREPYEDHGEMPRFNAMLESAIGALHAEGIIDRDRVGLTGFSRSVAQVLGALTFSGASIGAATVADGSAITPYSYVSSFASGPLMSNAEREIGAPPWGEGWRLWFERSPAFNYDRIRTPLRMEMYWRWADARWDTYVMLKRFQRPVELIHIPDGRHILIPPRAVQTSQQGTVDWYAFWLNGEEDTDPRKVEQYARWRKLRVQHHRQALE